MILKFLLKRQLDNLKKTPLFDIFIKISDKQKVPLEYLLAVGSRETNLKNIIGDKGNGVGVMQIDTRYHYIAKEKKEDGTWETCPEPLINFGAYLLRDNYEYFKRKYPRNVYTWAGDYAWWKLAFSAYNAGRAGAESGMTRGDSDLKTTGGNYAKDVINRSKIFADLLMS